MSDDLTARLALPLLHTAQAQKEETHNEALTLIDCMVHASVVASGVDTPPDDATPGASWIVGAAPLGAWHGHAHAVACWTSSGWRFVPPRTGMTVWDEARGRVMRHVAGAWEDGVMRVQRIMVDGVAVLQAQQPAIAAPDGGTTVDASARATIDAILTALRTHGLVAT